MMEFTSQESVDYEEIEESAAKADAKSIKDSQSGGVKDS